MMKKRIPALLILLLLFTAIACKKDVIPETPAIIPVPSSMIMGKGYHILDHSLVIHASGGSDQAAQVASYLASQLSLVMGFEVPVDLSSGSHNDGISLTVDPSLVNLGQEGYHLVSTKKSVLVKAYTADGLFRGVQTIFQMLPPQVYGSNLAQGVEWKLAAVEITDAPVFPWRGMHLDVSRHFFPKEFVKKYIDLIAMHKMSIFHWHLTDDNGWRIEIKKYPLLTEVSAWRVDREDKPWGQRELIKPGEKTTYGGFYTQDDIREIIQYAAERHITIIPEIEMPGHSYEVFASYPEYSCRGEKLSVLPGSYWPNSDIFCAGNDATFEFIDGILTEVAALFPSPYIHIGGDEADKTLWKKCPKCQARMKDEKLTDENELQSYFIHRVEKIVQAKGKRLVGWDEILEGGLAPEATVMSWRGYEGGIAAAKQGHDVIMCPVSHCYFDYYQGDPETEPIAIGGYTTLKKVYSFVPLPPDLTPDEAKHVLGGQGNVWTEYIPTSQQAEYMALPRMAALAEVLWSEDSLRNWDDFSMRIMIQFERYKAMGVNYSEGSFRVIAFPDFDQDGNYSLLLQTEASGAEIRYTLNGTDPDIQSKLYTSPVRILSDDTIHALAFKNGMGRGKTTVIPVVNHKALGKEFEWITAPSFKYKGTGKNTLLDGIRGSTTHNDGKWLGFEGTNMEIVIDLGIETDINLFRATFLHDQRRWIFLPDEVVFAYSMDGIAYQTLTKDNRDYNKMFIDPVVVPIADFKLSSPVRARYVKVIAINQGTIPEWHPGAGSKSWIFADEIVIK
jgi:hexosaminidase